MKTSIAALLIGAFGGLIAALCGVGGGIIMVPAFRQFLSLDQKQSIATSLVVIVPTALVASMRHLTSDPPLIGGATQAPDTGAPGEVQGDLDQEDQEILLQRLRSLGYIE